MAFYTEKVVTEIYNSVFDQSKYRSEFRLTPDKLFLSNMRILNLGLKSVETSEKRYNLVNGVGAVIKNIYLYDGSVILDKVINFADYSAFQAYNHTNQHNSDIAKLLSRNGLGFVYEKQPNEANEVSEQLTIKEAFPNCAHSPKLEQENTAMGYLNLRDVFPLLKGAGGMMYLHSGLFKNLKVVLEYGVSGSVVGEGLSEVTGTTVPILVADCLEDAAAAEKWLSEFKQQNWISVENESVTVPASAVAGTQDIKFRLTGSLNKFVNSVLIQKKGSTAVSALYGAHGSETMIDETFQIACNGENILPNSGITKSMERLAMLHDSFSVCNAHTSATELPMYNSAAYIDQASDRVGRLDYFGCVINQKVNSLDLSYSRLISLETGVPARYKQALTLNVFYGVLKAIVKGSKGDYQVVYL